MLSRDELIDQVLNSLSNANILEYLIIIGSWTVFFYRHHFKEAEVISPLRTRDIDIDVSQLKKAKKVYWAGFQIS